MNNIDEKLIDKLKIITDDFISTAVNSGTHKGEAIVYAFKAFATAVNKRSEYNDYKTHFVELVKRHYPEEFASIEKLIILL